MRGRTSARVCVSASARGSATLTVTKEVRARGLGFFDQGSFSFRMFKNGREFSPLHSPEVDDQFSKLRYVETVVMVIVRLLHQCFEFVVGKLTA